MKNLVKIVGIALVLPLAATSLSGCRRNGQLAEIAAEDLAEAVANQAISTYNTAALEVTVNGRSLGFDCSQGGTLTWAEMDSTGEICYVTTSNGCTMSGNYGTISLTGDYSVCGFPATYDEANGVQDLDGRTLYIEGSVQASARDHESRTCEYDLTLERISVTGTGDSATFSSSVSGTMCGDRGFSGSISFTVGGAVEPDDSATE